MSHRDIFLGADERYDVYCVKAAERPYLLSLLTNSFPEKTHEEEEDGEHKDDDAGDASKALPMVDGCDIPSWRNERMVEIPPLLASALNVGVGCTLLRRESQLPVALARRAGHPWEALREKLLQPPPPPSAQRVFSSAPACCSSEPTTTTTVMVHHDPPLPNGKQVVQPFSRFEEENVPVIILGCAQDWKARENWTFDKLVERFGDIMWRFSDTHGAVMTLATYAKYVSCVDGGGVIDDAPLAVYDSQFGEDDSPMQELVHEYTVPPCFSVDLFSFAEDDCGSSSDSDESHGGQRPPWRWILMGPPRSGTGLHIDPLWTNAWVTLLEGTKRWILIPPTINVDDDLPPGAGLRDPQVPSAIWFRDYYDQVSKIDGIVEILQRPGETVFVPNGWPHLVLNLEQTVAVTHNYASEFGPFERMWEEVLEEEPEFAERWYRGLLRHRPDLAQRIHRS